MAGLRGAAQWRERLARWLAHDNGHVLRLEHPATAELVPRYGYTKPNHQRLEQLLAAGIERYQREVSGLLSYSDDVARIPSRAEVPFEPCWINEWLIGLDTLSLYGYTRLRRPARYVEVGSGQSTKVVARARTDGGLDTTIVSIDPSPRAEIDQLCDVVHRAPLETVDLGEAFGGLAAGDVVFFDGTHRVLPNSDCVAFFLDVLPALPHGVLVGIHDIYLPSDYPQGFLEMWWSEQYLLAALLLGEPSWLDIVLPGIYASGRREVAALLEPLWREPNLIGVNPRGSAFWMEINRPS